MVIYFYGRQCIEYSIQIGLFASKQRPPRAGPQETYHICFRPQLLASTIFCRARDIFHASRGWFTTSCLLCCSLGHSHPRLASSSESHKCSFPHVEHPFESSQSRTALFVISQVCLLYDLCVALVTSEDLSSFLVYFPCIYCLLRIVCSRFTDLFAPLTLLFYWNLTSIVSLSDFLFLPPLLFFISSPSLIDSKVLESIIKNREVNFLKIYSLINTDQHGFRQGNSSLKTSLTFPTTCSVSVTVQGPWM